MYTPGINAVYHDSAAALLRDVVMLAAAVDERFTRVKHAKRPVPFSTWQLPVDPHMQAKLNEIKDREDFRPVAPVVMEEEANEWFINGQCAPFMLFVFDVRADKAARIPAVRHVDGTARVQTINRAQHPLYYDLQAAFRQRAGVPILVNTSFNTRGEPMVNSQRDAVESVWTSRLDALVIGPFLVDKAGRRA
jgi:carbamoyltransferase